MNALKTPDTEALLQHTADARAPDEYLQRQSDCIRALTSHGESVVAIVRGSSTPLHLRFEGLQVLFWLSPDDLDTFLHGLATSSDEPAVAEAARALLFRSQIRRTVSAGHPERLAAYLDSTRHEYAKWRFSNESRNA